MRVIAWIAVIIAGLIATIVSIPFWVYLIFILTPVAWVYRTLTKLLIYDK